MAAPALAITSAPAHRDTIDRPWYLSRHKCTYCAGQGRVVSDGQIKDCACVHRAVFDIVMRRVEMVHKGYRLPSVARRPRRGGFAMLDQELAADVHLIARRTLDARDFTVYVLACEHGVTWRVGCQLTRLDRGNWFHRVYSLQRRLGRAFLAYGLYPLGKYYS